MRASSYTAICAMLVLVFAAAMQLQVRADETSVACNVSELSPCLNSFIGPSAPSKQCCSKLQEQQPCLCGYLNNPAYKKYLRSGSINKLSKACGVPVPTC